MPNANARNRIVVFRLTEDEYRDLRRACSSKGGRNLSEFTRTELMAVVGSQGILGIIQDRFRELEDQILPLQRSLRSLTDMVSQALVAGDVNVKPSQTE